MRCRRCTSRGSGRRQRAQEADLGLDHERGRAEAGQQRDLGVPELDGEHAAELQRPLLALDVDLLLRQRERDAAAQGVALDPQLADLLEQLEHLAGRAVVDRLLGALVAQLRRGADAGPLDEDLGALPRLVDLDRPEQGRADLVGEQRAGVLGDRLRVERDLRVGAVEGLATLVRLQVDRVPGRDEGRHVGDGVVDDVAVAGALDVEGLVEVHRALGVDRDERQLRAVEIGQPRVGGSGLGRGEHLGREVARQLELGPDAGRCPRAASSRRTRRRHP